MSWFSKSTTPRKLSYWDQLNADYPPGSEWLYLGKQVTVLRTHVWSADGCPWLEPRVQYVDHLGNIVTTEVCLEALKKPAKEHGE